MLYTITQIAIYFDTNADNVCKWISRGKINVTQDGKKRYVTDEELERFKTDNPKYCVDKPSIRIHKLHYTKDKLEYELKHLDPDDYRKEIDIKKALLLTNRKLRDLNKIKDIM